jgi:hypothetical protein
MSEIQDGGPAFPQSNCVTCRAEYQDAPPPQGMSLRDWFAGQALAGLLVNPAPDSMEAMGALECAGEAYALADAMLKAREAK